MTIDYPMTLAPLAVLTHMLDTNAKFHVGEVQITVNDVEQLKSWLHPLVDLNEDTTVTFGARKIPVHIDAHVAPDTFHVQFTF